MIDDLYKKLIEAYSDKNLNTVTAKIIDLYRSKEHGAIKEITNIVSEYIDIKNEKINKCFNKLIMIYHPDRGNQYRSKIESLYHEKNLDELTNFSHIFGVQDYETVYFSNEEFCEADYNPGYVWDFDNAEYGDFSFVDDKYFNINEDDPAPKYQSFNDLSFFNAVKRNIYGNLNVEMPGYYLEDIEDIEMAEYDITHLEGIENCKHALYIDLSRNRISDISEIRYLRLVEELYLADNQIGYIDAVYMLKNLRVLDVSNNNVDDVSVIMELPRLEYVNLMGNKIPPEQIEKLRNRDVMVVY